MKAAVVALLLAVAFTGLVSVGAIRFGTGSSDTPPRAIVLPVGTRGGTLTPRHRAAVRQRVEHAHLATYAGGGRR